MLRLRLKTEKEMEEATKELKAKVDESERRFDTYVKALKGLSEAREEIKNLLNNNQYDTNK